MNCLILLDFCTFVFEQIFFSLRDDYEFYFLLRIIFYYIFKNEIKKGINVKYIWISLIFYRIFV